MRKHTPKTPTNKAMLKKSFAFLLTFVLLTQSLAFGTAAIVEEIGLAAGELSPTYSNVSGVGNLTSDEITAQLKKDLIKSFNQDLVKKVSDYEMSGPVNVIITFSENSVISAYTDSAYRDRMTYASFKTTGAAKRYEKKLIEHQNTVLDRLADKGLIDDVKYSYVHLLDGAYVATTYENLSAICSVEGVERVMMSNTYLPQAAVENPVDVYDTGIFNSGSVDYTGVGTLVAILDTGCDYTHPAFTTHQVVNPAFDRNFVAERLESTKAYELSLGTLEAREAYYGNITKDKIAFGYDYADKDADIMPFENSHGTHVAGIIAGKDDTTITGVAIDAQLAIMKVFSDYKVGAEDGDIIAALEDSVILGVDAINMSLGSSCGFTYESARDEEYKNELYGRIEDAGISLVVAASNDYSSGFGSEQGDTNKTTNPDSATVGAPSTYDAAMSVASINGKKDKYMLANDTFEVFFNESTDTSGDEYDFFKMLGIEKGAPFTYDYVTVPGYGMAVNYQGLDVNGKIALVRRGDITFEEKVQFAQEAGAIAVIIYNNVFGEIRMTIGNNAKIPAVSIGKDEGDRLAAQESGKLEFNLDNVAGPFMSDFSSWGPTPSLTLKPEITAHGGNILSSVVGGEYDELSGTSMAAPNMCGITVLIRQYVKERYPEMAPTAVRDLVNQLCMSTATIALNRKGNPYSPRKQGAGIADIKKATTTPAYLFVEVDGKDTGKTKLELGDDPARTGVYTMTIKLKNISDAPVSYTLGSIAMTETVSTSDPEYVAEMAYMLSNTATYQVEGAARSGDVITVAAHETAKITATITLSDKDKSYINSTFENGMYVEGFLTFTNTDENGVDLNAPFLAFYGDWGEAPIFDLDYYEVETEAHNNAIDDEDKIKADYYATTPTGTYYYDYIIPLGGYIYKIDESQYSAIPGTMDKAAISYYADSISGIYGVFTGLLRGAKEMTIVMKNTSTGEILHKETQYNCYKSHFNGSPYPYVADMRLPSVNMETGERLGDNNAKIEVTMSAKLDWDGGENVSDSYSFSFYIDYQAPTITDATFRTEYDKSKKENRYYLDMMVYDNHYAMSCRPIIVYDSTKEFDEAGNPKKTYSSLNEMPIPIYQETRGTTTKVTMEITDYLDLIADSSMPNGITIYLDDYAMNSSVSYIPFPGTDNEKDVEFTEDVVANGLNLDLHQTFDLTSLLVHKDTAVKLESDYLKTLKWEILSGEDILDLGDGQIETKKSGTAVIRVTSDSWVTRETVNGIPANIPIYKTLTVNVSETEADDPLTGDQVSIKDLSFSHYKTLFAHNSDIDYSELGYTGTTNYFGGNYSISCYPAESIQLYYELEPWNLDPDRCVFTWSSSNPSVATVDENGVVVAESEGRARITLNVKIDGKTSILAARLSVEVKSEFIIENRTLVAYKGKGGDVVIPEDEGILYIGAFAFSHFDLDNEKEVEKDENGYYDIDDKKTPLGNDTVTSVTIPDGVETIQKYAFWGCKKLSEVKLPKSCETISEYAFTNCVLLENVNFENVKVVSDYAFAGCESLSCEELGGAKTDRIYSIGAYGFAGTRFSSLSLPGLSRVGEGAFSKCEKLEELSLGKKTRISAKMFEGCERLTSVEIFSDTVGDEAFKDCKNLESVVFKNDLTYIGNSSFLGCKELSSITFCGVVEQIAPNAFYGCAALKTLNLPDCEIAIGDGAFALAGLTKIVFAPNTVLSTLGVSAFSKVNGLVLDLSQSAFYNQEGDAVYTKDGKTLVFVLPSNSRTFTVPAAVTTIADGAFSSLSKLTTVEFEGGSQLTRIGDCAFANCQALTTVTLPDNIITIGDYAFLNDGALKNIDLSNVKEIGAFAFNSTGLVNANLEHNGVVIGVCAFYTCPYLQTLTLGENAVIGDYAFAESGLVSVDLVGNAVIGKYAFAMSPYLTSFDFTDVTGALGDYAFYGCVALKSVIAPKITEIGEGTFSDCYALESLVADSLKKIGAGAFAPLSENPYTANSLTSLSLPSLVEIGESAFYFNVTLKSFNAPKLQKIGANAFYLCLELESITFSDELTDVPEMAFAYCVKLKSFDFSSLVTIGDYAFCGVPLPETLYLPNVESIGNYAFLLIESDDPSIVVENNLVHVTAPKLTKLGDQAFAVCDKLETFDAPALRKIGSAAFAYTALKKLEVSGSLESVALGAFEGCEFFETFFATVDEEEVTDADLGSVKLVDGVLYLAVPGGYALTVYPAAKDDTELTVMEGTLRIDTGAAMNATALTKVTLPSTLKYIGDYAFYGCDALKNVVFRSYFAPVLEGAMTANPEITNDKLADFPGFETLYRYDYFFRLNHVVTMPLYYTNFIATIGSKAADGIVATIPENCEGYDSLLYQAYFDIAKERGEITVGKFAVNFIDAVQRLPEKIDRFDKILVQNAIFHYNALLAHEDELDLVDAAVIARYEAALTTYNVDFVESLIDHLFDMDKSKYSFDKVKEARAAYLALTDAERDLITNKARLDQKLADINTAFGTELDFTKNYEDYVSESEPPVVEPPVDEPKDGLAPWVIVLIVVGSVLVAGGVAVLAVVLVKKNQKPVRKFTYTPGQKKIGNDQNNTEE